MAHARRNDTPVNESLDRAEKLLKRKRGDTDGLSLRRLGRLAFAACVLVRAAPPTATCRMPAQRTAHGSESGKDVGSRYAPESRVYPVPRICGTVGAPFRRDEL